MVKKSKKKSASKKLIISISVALVIILIAVLSLMFLSKEKPAPVNDLQSNEEDNLNIIEEVIEDLKEVISDETCEEKAKKLTPDTIRLAKNTLDPLWSVDPKNTTLNFWTDGKVLVPDRFLRYQLSTGNVFKAEKSLIKNPHYYVYDGEEVKFEINPSLKEKPETLVVEEGFGGRLFYWEDFSVDDLGLIYCQMKR
jgi:hypothetical protein